jgi:hypothetical protein
MKLHEAWLIPLGLAFCIGLLEILFWLDRLRLQP